MRYHADVCMQEQLTELSRAQEMPGIRPQIQMRWRENILDAGQEQNEDKEEV